MKKIILLFLANLILALFQTSFLAELFGANLTPNLILAFAFSLFLSEAKKESQTSFLINKFDEALLSVFIGGLIVDLLTLLTPGISSFTMVILLSVSFYVRKYLLKSWLSSIFLIYISAVIYIFGINFQSLTLYKEIFSNALLTLFLSLIFYRVSKSFVQKGLKVVFNENSIF